MFWDLKGATLYPSCLNILHNPATKILFPAFDAVPCIIITLAIFPPPYLSYKNLLIHLYVFHFHSLYHGLK